MQLQSVLEKALLESEKRYRTLYEDNPSMYFTLDPDANVASVNEFGASQLGYAVEELTGQPVGIVVHDEDKQAVLDQLRESLRNPGKVYFWRFRKVRRDGTILWVEEFARTIEQEDGSRSTLVVCQDATDRQRAAEALRESEARYRSLVEQLPAATYRAALDEGGSGLYVSPQIESLTGYTPAEWCVRPSLWQTRIHPEDRRAVLEALKRSLTTYEPFVTKYRLLTKGRGEIMVRDEAAVVRNDEGRPLFLQGIMVDITERNRMEQELLKARKLESVGALAGGIAHDFNNLLMGILGNISLAKLETRPDSSAFARLDKAEKAALRATGLTQQLRTFSKGGAPVKKVASIRELLKETATFVLSGSNVQARFDIADDLWPADVDEGQISQVIENLVINATQSMAGGGVVRIKADNSTVEANEVVSLRPGKYLTISVRDQGEGIEPQYLERIFDPYFSTKETGSGLGLATSYAIIAKHGGIIAVESEPGRGSMFTIYLPASTTVVKAAQATAPRSRILVVDDEAIVRETVGQMLASMQYEPKFAESGVDAVRMWQKAREKGEPLDAVIMDLTMPGGMGGTETMKKLLEIDPEAAGIVSTGYSEDPAMTDFKQYGFRGRIAKPYRVQDLSLVLKGVLERRKAAH